MLQARKQQDEKNIKALKDRKPSDSAQPTGEELLCNLLTVWVSSNLIETFKSEKCELYRRVIHQFATCEIENNHSLSRLFNGILQNDSVMEKWD